MRRVGVGDVIVNLRPNYAVAAMVAVAMLHCGDAVEEPPEMPAEIVLPDATTPQTLKIDPADLVFDDAADATEIRVLGVAESGDALDVTLDSSLELRLENSAVASLTTLDETRRVVRPLTKGRTRLIARLGSLETEVPVRVDVCRPTAPVLEQRTLLVDQPVAQVGVQLAAGLELEVSGPAGLLRIPPTSTSTMTVSTSTVVAVAIPVDQLNRRHRVTFTAIDLECDGRSSQSFLDVTHDSVGPRVQLEFPTRSANLRDRMTTNVFGRVGDTLTGLAGLSVTVNGVDASVTAGQGANGRFAVMNVPIDSDEIVVVARDGAGNETRTVQAVRRSDALGDFIIDAVQSSMQSGAAGARLANPLEVVVRDLQGAVVADRLVSFEVTRGSGLVADPAAPNEEFQIVQVRTNGSGEASILFRLGMTAGDAAHQVSASIVGAEQPVVFVASATPAAATTLALTTGADQSGEIGALAADPLRVWVSDGLNGIEAAQVKFTVVRGDGLVDDFTERTVASNSAGFAEVAFRFGVTEGTTIVEAALEGSDARPVTFMLRGMIRSDADTTYVGRVENMAGQPLEGARVTLVGDQAEVTADTDAEGRFVLSGITFSGMAHLDVRGDTVIRVAGQPLSGEAYPSLSYPVTLVPGAENQLGRIVTLPPLVATDVSSYSTRDPTVLTVNGVDGFSMTIQPGSMQLANGLPAPDGTQVRLNLVDIDRIPMPMPNGAAPSFAWTLQPAGAHFDPPVQVTFPNTTGLAPGEQAYFLNFDHDTESFEIVASARVSPDGALIQSEPGEGLRVAGWGGACPPYSIFADVFSCAEFSLAETLASLARLGGEIVDFIPWSGCAKATVSGAISAGVSAIQAYREEGGQTQATAALTAIQSAKAAAAACLADTQNELTLIQRIREGLDIGLGVAGVAAATGCFGDSFEETVARLQLADQVTDGVLDTFDAETRARALLAGGCSALGITSTLLENSMDGEPMDEAMLDEQLDVLRELQRQIDEIEGMDPADLQTIATELQSSANEVSAAVQQPELAGFELSLAGVTTTVEADGSFRLSNISVPDDFGEGGPGTPRDFVSDDFIRIIGQRENGDGTIEYAFSERFRLRQREVLYVPSLTITDIPPPQVDRLALTAPAPEIDGTGNTLQLTAVATLTDGDTQDVTLAGAWTSYRSSNPEIATVSADGLVTAVGTGRVIITATNDGSVAAVLLGILADDPRTTVEGFVVDRDGNPAANASVSAESVTDQTNAQGFFTLSGVPTQLGDIVVSVIAGEQSGQSAPTRPVPAGITDVGTIELGRPDTVGREFLVVFQPNFSASTNTLFISSAANATGIIESAPLGLSRPFVVEAGTVLQEILPANSTVQVSDAVSQQVIRVSVDTDASVYALNRVQFTTDALVALPTDTFDTEYRVMSWPASVAGTSQFAVMANEADTTVNITLPINVGGRVAGETYQVTLQALETYQLLANAGDLTGTLITADRPIGVTAGHRCANIPDTSVAACDHLVEQMPPTSSWGQEVVVVPLATRIGGDTVRIMARDDETAVVIEGPNGQSFTLAAGEYQTLGLDGFHRIRADRPILVAQYSNGTFFDGVVSDPFMQLVLSPRQVLRGYILATPGSGFATNYINVTSPIEDVMMGRVRLDGEALDPALFTEIASSGIWGAQVPISVGSHTLSSARGIGVTVYGFADADSYGYSAGMLLRPQ